MIRLTIDVDREDAETFADYGLGYPEKPIADAIRAALPNAVEIPEPIKVGDRVRTMGATVVGTVLALADGSAWVYWDDSTGPPLTVYLSVLRKVEG